MEKVDKNATFCSEAQQARPRELWLALLGQVIFVCEVDPETKGFPYYYEAKVCPFYSSEKHGFFSLGVKEYVTFWLSRRFPRWFSGLNSTKIRYAGTVQWEFKDNNDCFDYLWFEFGMSDRQAEKYKEDIVCIGNLVREKFHCEVVLSR